MDTTNWNITERRPFVLNSKSAQLWTQRDDIWPSWSKTHVLHKVAVLLLAAYGEQRR